MSDSSARLSIFRRAGWELRLRGDAAGDPTAQTLHVLMLMLLLLLSIHVGVAEILNPHKLLITTLGVPMIFTPVTTLVLLRKNAVRAAGIVYLVGMWMAFTAIIALNGGIHHVALAVYIALAVSAAWLFGYRAALLTAGICLAVTFMLAILEETILGPWHYLPGTPTGIWMLVAESTLMGVVPVTLVLSSLRKALTQSQQAEAELKIHQQHLEELVQERTAELVEARDQAYAANRAKTTFLASMSHELRTPLNAILGYSTLVRDDPDLPERFRKDLEIVNRSGEHLLSLIDDVLDVAKIEAGRVTLEKTPVQIRELLRDSADLMRPKAEEKGLTLVLRQSPLVPRFVHSDPGKLRQVLINLIGNAVKYTALGGIIVNAEVREDGNGRTLVLEVSDTGIGIDPKDHGRVFEPFVQAGSTSGQKGTGLGLAISQRFIELMGGRLSLQSAPGLGSTFRIELSAENVEELSVGVDQPGRRRVVRLAADQPEYRVLIVEDQAENSMMLERILRGVGFQTTLAQDGEQALEMFASWRPHWIWMDLRLPVLSGVDAAKRIRALDGGREVKIVAVTASAFDSQREEVIASGFDEFLRKPYRSSEIFDCMAAHLGVRYLYGQAEPGMNDTPVMVRPEDLEALPAGLCAELEQALLSLDAARIALVVGQISAENAALGTVLESFAEKLAYSPILAALRMGNDRLAGATACPS
jgi:signal transduction histidine kinase/DNA-binding response OmpR family regulator